MIQDHYRTLGVAPSATQAELRSAYLKLARANHPDSVDQSQRAVAEARMQQINQAWSIVGVAHKRREYDSRRPQANQANQANGHSRSASSPGPQRGNAKFRPFATNDDDEDLIDRSDVDLDPSTLRGSGAVPRWISLMPIAFIGSGACTFGLGLLVRASSILAFAAAMVLVGGVGLLAMPLIVMSRADKDPYL